MYDCCKVWQKLRLRAALMAFGSRSGVGDEQEGCNVAFTFARDSLKRQCNGGMGAVNKATLQNELLFRVYVRSAALWGTVACRCRMPCQSM